MTNQNQPSEVKEGGALEAAAFRLQAFIDVATKYAGSISVGGDAQMSYADLRTVLDALAARPPSMERGEAEGSTLHPEPDRTKEVISAAYAYLSTVRVVDGAMPEPAYLVQRLQARLERISKHLARLTAAPSPAPSAVEMAGVEEMVKALEPFTEALASARDRYPEAGSAYVLQEACSNLSLADFEQADAILALATASREKGDSAARELPLAADMSCGEMLEALMAADDALAQITAFEDDARQIMGNTNFNIVQMRREQVKAAIAKATPSPASMPQTGGEA